MEYYRHEIRAGAIVVAAGLILLGMLFFSADLAFWFKATKKIYVTFKNVSGLAAYDPVLYKGVKVGKVTELQVLTDGSGLVQVTLDIEASLPLYRQASGGRLGSEFKIITTGLLGESAIEITAGDVRNPELEPESVVPGKEMVRMEELANLVQEIATDVRDAMNTITQSVNDPEVQAKFKTILDSLSDASVNLNKVVSGNVTNINEIVRNLSVITRDLNETTANLRVLSADLSQVVAQNKEDFNTLVDNYQKLPVSVEADFNQVQQSITSLIEENRRQINELIQHMDATSKHVEELTEDIKKNPWKVMRKP
ncbi:MAG: hypothetical protein A2V67_16780 [Deltaproteobacteria bacterium RBG_13_61_14]|nr:MAG: hypothetical protein A2V67_16780 [Deltaproteobacteria bacterium RBG_13_61_14]